MSSTPEASAYLDHAATTPLRPVAAEAMVGAHAVVGNPSSTHAAGRRARARLEEAREALAESLDADPTEVVWTSGGTEADNLAVVGAWRARPAGRDRLVVGAVEHHAVLDAVDHLVAHEGAQVTWLAPDPDGRVRPDAVATALASADDVALVSVMWAGNEVGVVHDLPAIATVAHESGIPVHSDAVAAFGHLPLSFRQSGVDLLSVTAHKLGGPVGTGALVVRRGIPLAPMTYGGGQERRLRSGTLDVAGAAGFAAAAQEACATLPAESARTLALRDRLLAGASDLGLAVTGDWVPGDGVGRLPGNVSLWVPGADVDALLSLLDLAGVSVAAGSACTAGVARFSHVLTAMGYAEGTGAPLRATLGWSSTEADVEALLTALPGAVAGARRALEAAR